MSTWAIVVAAGSGERFGQRKQYQPLGGRRVVDWALGAARTHCDGVVLVVPVDVAEQDEDGADAVVSGGATRSDSVRRGLAAVPADATTIVVHDAARPVPVPDVWVRVLDAVAAGADGAVPAIPVTDSLRAVEGGAVDRRSFVAVQTPQAFAATALRRAHEGGEDASDDATLVEASGGRVVVVDGDPTNVKVTSPTDLLLAEQLCR